MCVRYTCINDRRCISSQGCPGVKRVDKTAGPHHDPPASIRWGHPLQRSFCSCEGMLLPHAARLEKQGKGRGASTPRRPHSVPDPSIASSCSKCRTGHPSSGTPPVRGVSGTCPHWKRGATRHPHCRGRIRTSAASAQEYCVPSSTIRPLGQSDITVARC